MLSLVFTQLDGENIMLPIAQTAFEEKKNPDGTIYVLAYYNQDRFKLNTNLNEIIHMCSQGARPNIIPGGFPPGHNLRPV